MTGVGTGIGRDAVIEPFDEGLHIIVPHSGIGRTLNPCHQNSAQVIVGEEFLLVVAQIRGFGPTLLIGFPIVGGDSKAHTWNHGHGLMAAVEHQSGYLLDGELRGEVGSTLLGREAPVLIGVERVVAVQVLEGKAVDRQQFHA